MEIFHDSNGVKYNGDSISLSLDPKIAHDGINFTSHAHMDHLYSIIMLYVILNVPVSDFGNLYSLVCAQNGSRGSCRWEMIHMCMRCEIYSIMTQFLDQGLMIYYHHCILCRLNPGISPSCMLKFCI